MEKAQVEIISNQEIRKIRKNQRPIDIGSDISCYLYDKNTVIKTFEITCPNPEEKLFLSNQIYGNSSYIFTNRIQRNENGLLLSYTQPFIRGYILTPYEFNEILIKDLLIFIKQILLDTQKIAHNGIYAYDNFISNIIINDTGFHCIDTIDFKLMDKDPKIIEKENIEIFFTNFWDYLLTDDLKDFCLMNGLSKYSLFEDPYSFFVILTNKVQLLTDNEVSHIKNIKILTKKR